MPAGSRCRSRRGSTGLFGDRPHEVWLPALIAGWLAAAILLATLVLWSMFYVWRRRQYESLIDRLERELAKLRNLPFTEPAPLEDLPEVPNVAGRTRDERSSTTTASTHASGAHAGWRTGTIIITASAIVISVSVTQFNVDELRWSLVILVAFVLLALLSSVMAVFPKFKIHPEPGDQLPPGFSPFFFGHFSQISKQRHVELMADVLRNGNTTYRVMVEDIYDQGFYMLKNKYRYLRFS